MKALDNRFYVKFMRLEIGLFVPNILFMYAKKKNEIVFEVIHQIYI